MTDLIAFITARLAEDQEAARKAASLCGCHPPAPGWTLGDDEAGGRILIDDDPHPAVAHKLRKRWNGSYNDMFAAAHIARHDPARVLREVQAKRQLLAQYAAVLEEVRAPKSAEHYANARARQFQLELALPLLALPYSDHPGWREEWRP